MKMLQAMKDKVGRHMRSQENYPDDPNEFISKMTQELVEEKT